MSGVEIIRKPDLAGKRFAFALTEDRVGHYPEFHAHSQGLRRQNTV